MNKLFTKIATAIAGFAMVVGVGVGIGLNVNKQAKPLDATADSTITLDFSTAGYTSFDSGTVNQKIKYTYGGSGTAVAFTQASGEPQYSLKLYSGRWLCIEIDSTGSSRYTSFSTIQITATSKNGSTSGTGTYYKDSMTDESVYAHTLKTSSFTAGDEVDVDGASKIYVSCTAGQYRIGKIVLGMNESTTVEATGISFNPASPITCYSGDEVSFVPTLTGGSGAFKTTISWASSNTSVIANPANSTDRATVSVTPSNVASLTAVTLTASVVGATSNIGAIVLNVNPAKVYDYIYVDADSSPDKTNYYVGDSWDYAGLVLKVHTNYGEEIVGDVQDLLDAGTLTFTATPSVPTLRQGLSISDLLYMDSFDAASQYNYSFSVDGISVTKRPIADILRTTSTSLNHSTNSYQAVSDITKTGHSDIVSEATYAGYYFGATSPRSGAMQLNPNKSTYICTTASSQLLKSIAVVFNDANSNGVKFFGSNTAYTATYDANGSASSTELGTLTADGTVNVTGNYKYLYIVPTGTTYVDSFTVTWKTAQEEVEDLSTRTSLAYHYESDVNDDYTYSNICIRFGGKVSKTLWDRLDDESTITGFGVMIADSGFVATHSDFVEVINDEDFVSSTISTDLANNLAIDYFVPVANLGTVMGEEGDYYFWNLRQSVDQADIYTAEFSAIAYIKVADEYVLMNMAKESVESLAQDYLDNRGYDQSAAAASLHYSVDNAPQA